MWKKRYQFLAALSATISEISDGMQYGWSAPITPILLSKDSPVPVQESQIVWIETSLLIGTIVGIPITIYLLETFGRKQAILMATVQNVLAWILISCANSIYIIYLARFLSGIAASVVFASAPVYVAEIAEKEIRGFLSSFFSLMMLGGVLLVYCVAPFVSVPASSAVGVIFLILQLVTFPFLPESPYYDIIRGRIGSARKSLKILRGTEEIEEELEAIADSIAKEEAERGKLTDLFTVKSNRDALLVIVGLNAAQHLAGISIMLMNLHIILQNAASSIAPSTVAILFGVVMWLAAFVGSYCIDRLGRKPVLLFSCITTGIVLFVLAIYLTILKNNPSAASYGWVPVVLVLIYAGSFRIGLGLIPIILSAELFPTSVKSIGVPLSEASFTVVAYLAVLLFPYSVDALGVQGAFYIFGICCFLTTAFVIFIVPETKGKTLHEIQHMIKNSHTENTSLLNCSSITSLNNILNGIVK